VSVLQLRWALAVTVSAVVFCVTIAMRARILATQDLYLHIAIGRWILTHRQIPYHDIFSSGIPGAPWVAHEWLASLGMALLYDHLGWGGIVLTAGVMMALTIGALTLQTALRLGPIGALCAALLAWGVCIAHLSARPHLVALPLTVIWIAAHVRARRADSVPPLYLVPLMTLWANLHGSFLFGLVFTALFAAEAIFESDKLGQALVQARRWSLFLGISLLAALVTPQGPSGILFPVRLVSMGSALEGVQEWKASSLSNNPAFIMWCLLLLFLVLWRGVRLPLCRLIMFVLLLYMAFAHTRYSELLGLLTPLLLLDRVANILSRSAPAAALRWNGFARPAVTLSTVCVALLAAAAAAIACARDGVRAPDRVTPAAALAAVQAGGITGPVLNSYNFGGYLIFRGYAPFIDGRVDLYGNAFASRFFALDQLTGLLEQYHIAWTMFEPENPRTVVMDNLSGWSRFYADGTAVVHVRDGAASR
jgi:hypothetical protein